MAIQNPRPKVLLADNSPQRTALLRTALEDACYRVVAIPENPPALLLAVDVHRPDIIIIDTDSPSHEMLAHLLTINQANLKLSERKLVDRARGILMKSRGISEDEAYHALRRLAMTRTKRIGETARLVIDMEYLIA